MHVPSGFSGVHAVPNTPHSYGFAIPRSTSPQRHAFGSSMRAPGTSKRFSASHSAKASAMRRPLRGIAPRPRHSKSSRTANASASAASACGFPSVRTTRPYAFSTSARPSRSWRSSIATAWRMSVGSNPATTTGRPYSEQTKSYGRVPITVETWPGPTKPSIPVSGESRIARSAGPMSTWLQKTEKLRTPSSRARRSVSAVAGAVVSKPTPKKTTSRPGSRCAMPSASSGE